MSKSLTPKQELFCQEYIKTGNASEAYRIAYPTSLKWKAKSVNEKASSELANNVKIVSRVKELQAEQEAKHGITKEKIVNRLKEVIFDQESLGVDKIDLTALNKAVDTINKMQGYYEPEKLEIKGVKSFEDFYSE